MIDELGDGRRGEEPCAASRSGLGRRLLRRRGLAGGHLRLRPGAHCPASAAPPLPRIPEGRKYRMMMSST